MTTSPLIIQNKPFTKVTSKSDNAQTLMQEILAEKKRKEDAYRIEKLAQMKKVKNNCKNAIIKKIIRPTKRRKTVAGARLYCAKKS